jgi:hypothetical protein
MLCGLNTGFGFGLSDDSCPERHLVGHGARDREPEATAACRRAHPGRRAQWQMSARRRQSNPSPCRGSIRCPSHPISRHCPSSHNAFVHCRPAEFPPLSTLRIGMHVLQAFPRRGWRTTSKPDRRIIGLSLVGGAGPEPKCDSWVGRDSAGVRVSRARAAPDRAIYARRLSEAVQAQCARRGNPTLLEQHRLQQLCDVVIAGTQGHSAGIQAKQNVCQSRRERRVIRSVGQWRHGSLGLDDSA